MSTAQTSWSPPTRNHNGGVLPHWIRPNESTRVPRRHVVLAHETPDDPVGAQPVLRHADLRHVHPPASARLAGAGPAAGPGRCVDMLDIRRTYPDVRRFRVRVAGTAGYPGHVDGYDQAGESRGG